MTSQYRQGVIANHVHCQVDIIFSLLTFLINISSYTTNTTSTCLLH